MSYEELNGEILRLLYVIIGLAISTYLRRGSTYFLQEYLAIDMKMDIYSKFIKNDMFFF